MKVSEAVTGDFTCTEAHGEWAGKQHAPLEGSVGKLEGRVWSAVF